MSAHRAVDSVCATVIGTVVQEDELALEVLLGLLSQVALVAFVGLSDYLHVPALVDLNPSRSAVLANQRVPHLPRCRQLHPACLQVARPTNSVALTPRSCKSFCQPSADFVIPAIHQCATVVIRTFGKGLLLLSHIDEIFGKAIAVIDIISAASPCPFFGETLRSVSFAASARA